jgi:uncharacterized protein YoaH (UPF0181 family)
MSPASVQSGIRRLAVALIVGLGFATLSCSAHAQQDCRSEELYEVSFQDAYGLSSENAEALVAAQLQCVRKAAENAEPDEDELGMRVVGGHLAEFENFYDVVRIDYNGRPQCTGVLVALDTVLTAGHCGCGANYRIYIQYTAEKADRQAQFMRLSIVAGPILFPGYRCNLPPEVQPGRDLAMLRIDPWQPTAEENMYDVNLAEPAGESSLTHQTLINLSTIRPSLRVLGDLNLRSLYLVGFGQAEPGVNHGAMRGAFVGMLSRFCQLGRVYSSYCAWYREFALAKGGLTADTPNVDSCGGDSGGPVFRMDSSHAYSLGNGPPKLAKVSRRTLVGIVSRGLIGVTHPYPGFCGGGGIYTAVGTRPVLDWFAQQGVAFRFSEALKDHDVAQEASN